jgi:hypothetical protein
MTTRYITIAFDIGTTGFTKDDGSMEIVHFAAIKEDGSIYSKHFMPKGPFSVRATETNGLTMEKLRQMEALPFTKHDAIEIAKFMPGRK